MYNLPAEFRYSPDHLWVRAGPDTSVVRVGITDFAQQSLGDVTNLTLPTAGRAVQAGRWCGEIESTKSTSDLIAPVSATVTTVNEVLRSTPELVNSDPYGRGWIFDAEIDYGALAQQLADFMDVDSHGRLVNQ
jgi:glycine cleavage system H protein